MAKVTITGTDGKKMTIEEGHLIRTKKEIPRGPLSPIPCEKNGRIKKIKTIDKKLIFVVIVGTKEVDIPLEQRHEYLDFNPKADPAEVNRIMKSLSNDKIF